VRARSKWPNRPSRRGQVRGPTVDLVARGCGLVFFFRVYGPSIMPPSSIMLEFRPPPGPRVFPGARPSVTAGAIIASQPLQESQQASSSARYSAGRRGLGPSSSIWGPSAHPPLLSAPDASQVLSDHRVSPGNRKRSNPVHVKTVFPVRARSRSGEYGNDEQGLLRPTTVKHLEVLKEGPFIFG